MYPHLIDLGPVRIYTYGFFLALGFVAAIYVAGREARRLGVPSGRFYDLCFFGILAALVGSRLLYVILEYPKFLADPLQVFALWKGGLVFHGGVIVAVLVVFWYMRRHALPVASTFDALGYGMPIGQALGRVGCFMAGCCYGSPSNLPWAVIFTHPESLCDQKGIALHPSQLYEAVLALGIFGVLYWLKTRKRFEGQLVLSYFCLAGLARFGVEFVRSPFDYRGPEYWGLPLTQIVALVVALTTGGLLLWAWLRAKAGTEGRAG